MKKRILDAHVHVWDLTKAKYAWLENDTSILNRTYQIEELTSQVAKAGVTDGILVQAANNIEDTDAMLETAAKTDWIKAVVGWLPLLDPEQTESILNEKYAKSKYLKGCRHLIHNEANPEWLLQEPVIESLKILEQNNIPFDLVGIHTEHLQTAIKLAQKIPGLKMVFDHLNQPPISSKEQFGKWGGLMKEASLHKNFYAKISGLGTTAGKGFDWDVDDISPYVLHTLELFGADRCFCGGDWPVALLAGPYEKAWLAYQEIIEKNLAAIEQEKLLFSNAFSFYNLSASS